MRVLVIGAGASGLVTAKTLKERGHDVSIIEASNIIGGTFENKRYKNARMVSSKYLTCFSDFRKPEAEMHMSLADYAVYLRDYAEQFGLLDCIQLGTCIESIKRTSSGDYEAVVVPGDARHGHVEKWDAVAVCSGLHNVPRVPTFPGQDSFSGTVLHSADYKDPDIFKGKRVLVVGSGETGFDLAYAAATNGASEVTISTRHGFVSVPACFGGNLPPLDCIIMNWATHGWESQWAQRVGLHWWITTKFTRLSFLLWTGTTYGFNQWGGRRYNMTWDEGRKHIVNKSSRCMPLITRKIKRQAPWWLRAPWWNIWDTTEGIDIDLVEGGIQRMDQGTVHFDTESGSRTVDADIVVLATGYKQRFPFLSSEQEGEDALPEEHFVVNPEEPNMAYIGFVRPNVGAIPPMSELQAMWWCEKLEGKLVCKSPDYYKLHGSRLSYGVDYGYYMFALAREINAIPSLLHWAFKNPCIAITCAFGQAHIPLFRLEGPFRDPKAQEICANELLGPILQRPIFMNAIFLIEAIGLGAVNAFIAAFESRTGRIAISAALVTSLLRHKRLQA